MIGHIHEPPLDRGICLCLYLAIWYLSFSNTDNRSGRPRFNWRGFKSLLKDLKRWDAGLYALVIFCPIVRGCLGHGGLHSHKVGPNRVDTFRARCQVTTKNAKISSQLQFLFVTSSKISVLRDSRIQSDDFSSLRFLGIAGCRRSINPLNPQVLNVNNYASERLTGHFAR